MKIINLVTNNIFDLPKTEALFLLEDNPTLFAKVSKNMKIIKNNKSSVSENSVLSKILDE